jgi:hypothetical protein
MNRNRKLAASFRLERHSRQMGPPSVPGKGSLGDQTPPSVDGKSSLGDQSVCHSRDRSSFHSNATRASAPSAKARIAAPSNKGSATGAALPICLAPTSYRPTPSIATPAPYNSIRAATRTFAPRAS